MRSVTSDTLKLASLEGTMRSCGNEYDSASAARQQDVSCSPDLFEPIAMRVPDACRYIGISRSSLYILIAKGELEVVKLGASTLVLTESLKSLIEARRQPRNERREIEAVCERDATDSYPTRRLRGRERRP